MKPYFTLLFSLVFLVSEAQTSTLRINELMSSNGSTVMSGYGLYSDWIEIYNSGNQIVDLGGIYITDDAANLMKYRFPYGQGLEITPGGYFLVWADDSANTDHTNFKLSSTGETLVLVDTNGTSIIDSVSFPALGADQSWGRSVDGIGSFQIFNQGSSTPSASNNVLNYAELNLFEDLIVFPNPAGEMFFISGLSHELQMETVEIYSVQGQLLMTYPYSAEFNQGISIGEFPSGLYFISISRGNKKATFPLLHN
jgi:hypothetical protein